MPEQEEWRRQWTAKMQRERGGPRQEAQVSQDLQLQRDRGTSPDRSDDGEPKKPSDREKPSWGGVLKRTVAEFQDDNLIDWAAALTYYGLLSLDRKSVV